MTKFRNLRNLILCLAAFSAPNPGFAAECVPADRSTFFQKLAGVETSFSSRAVKILNGKQLKRFDVAKYFEEREKFWGMEDLPAHSPKDAESMLAWQETVRERVQPLKEKQRPTIDQVWMSDDVRTQKKLISWRKQYATRPGKLSEAQIARAALDLELILHHSELTWSELAKYGRNGLAERWVQAQYAGELTRKGMVSVLGENEAILRKPKFGQWIREWAKNQNVQAVAWGSADAAALVKGASPVDLLYVIIPKYKFFKLSESEITDVLRDGLDQHFATLTAKYKKKIPYQVVYNAFERLSHQVAIPSLIYTFVPMGIEYGVASYQQWQAEKKMVKDTQQEIKEKGTPGLPPLTFDSREFATPTSTPTPW